MGGQGVSERLFCHIASLCERGALRSRRQHAGKGTVRLHGPRGMGHVGMIPRLNLDFTHTPFNLNSNANQHSVYIPGTNTIIQPTGSYMPAPPSGAPGFRNEQVGGWQGDKSQRRDDWGGTKLVGRREGTFQVLDDHAADAVRNKAFFRSERSI